MLTFTLTRFVIAIVALKLLVIFALLSKEAGVEERSFIARCCLTVAEPLK